VENPHQALQAVLAHLYEVVRPEPAVHPTAIVPASVRMGNGAIIGPYAVIGEEVEIGDRITIGAHAVIGARCRIGDDVVIHPHVTMYEGVTVMDRVVIHSGVRLGTDGFGYVWKNGAHEKVPQIGGCVVEADVEIGANSAIDRGSIGDTTIGAGSKLDNLVHVGHNVQIGRKVMMAGQVGIAGSATLGDGSVYGGQAGVSGHIDVGTGARIGGQAGVIGDVPPGATYSGYPARPHREALRAQAGLFKIMNVIRRLTRLEAKVFGPGGEKTTLDRPESAPSE
jgi:UDP-3-O-[3-hydroxymyristoyl] glucosamine N-acyltransferase